MRVLIACEFSGVVRDAFRKRGHDAWSCDLLDSERPGNHLAYNVLGEIWPTPSDSANRGVPMPILSAHRWDILIAHPPCTHLAVSGARWFKDKAQGMANAIAFVEALWSTGISRICIENPVGILSTRSILGKPTQIIQPWQFGHGETKATCLWLKNLPQLVPTDIVEGRVPRVHHASPGPDRWKERSRTLQGIADAMADQWGQLGTAIRNEPTSEAAGRIAQRLGFCEEGSRMKDADGIDRDGNGKLMFPEYVAANKATPEELDRRYLPPPLEEAQRGWICFHCGMEFSIAKQHSYHAATEAARAHFGDTPDGKTKCIAAADLIESLVQKNGDMRNAIIAYDAAIRSCANEPEKMASFCTAQGDNLDALYAAMIDAAKVEPDAH